MDAPAGRAFTMIEMLLSITITLVMVLFLNTIFSSIASTVSLGVATSDIIQANAVFTKQLGDDASAMVGPLSNGFMVIIQKKVTSVRQRPTDPPTSTQRSDQIIWIRTTTSTGDVPITPRTPGNPAAYADAASLAANARVWFGHALRTNANGTLPNGANLGVAPNDAAIRWVLGRQALFLNGPQNLPLAYINSAAAYPSWTVNTYASVASAPSPPSWYKGLSDVFDRDLNGVISYFGGVALPLNITGSGYPAGPYRLTYGDYRLWCNPNPTTNGVEPWQEAQRHPIFLLNVSDLRIDFAGDYDGVAGVDLNLASGGIKWYSHFANPPGATFDPSEPETYPPPVYSNLVPYGFATDGSLIPRAIYQPNPPGLTAPMANADAAFTFVPLGLDWPQMIRFRYRVHDERGQLADRDGLRGKLFERVIQVKRQ